MRALEKKFQEAGSKRAGYPDVGQGWPVYEKYAETKDGDDILLDADVKPLRGRRPPGTPAGMEVGGLESVRDQQERSVKRYIAPLTQHKDLFLKFARHVPSGPMPEMQEALRMVRAWVSEYGVLGLASVDDDPLRPGKRESVHGFWVAASRAKTVLDLYEAAIPEKPGKKLGEVLMRWEPGLGWDKQPVNTQREYALKYVGDKVGRVVKDECYPLIYREVNKAKYKTQGFTYDFGFRSLLGAMYLQMMLLLTDADNVRQCQSPGCGKIIPPGSNKNRMYCLGGACKQRPYDNKKRLRRQS